jgi:hypothetical protein
VSGLPETGCNIEVCEKLNETAGRKKPNASRLEYVVEILEAVILALVAVATAWSGYQAAQWDGVQTELYGNATDLNIEAAELMSIAGQEVLYDANTFDAWLDARYQGDIELAEFYERRFRDEYRVAFDAWMKTDPFSNSSAPPGPILMPEYRNSMFEESREIRNESTDIFEQGTKARGIADDYVRVTVFLAVILVLISISQRFEIKAVRTGLLFVSFLLLAIGLLNLITLPRLI